MKFKYIPRTPEENPEWKDILLRRKLLAAAESSSSAATGRGRKVNPNYSTAEKKCNTQ